MLMVYGGDNKSVLEIVVMVAQLGECTKNCIVYLKNKLKKTPEKLGCKKKRGGNHLERNMIAIRTSSERALRRAEGCGRQ